MIKTYAYIKFEAASPLAIGSGQSKETDKDIIRNSRGEPYIPATALAGVYSSLFDENLRKQYFGYVNINRSEIDASIDESPQSKESKIIVYDGILCENENPHTSIRDGVGLDEFRYAKTGAKFDFEILEPGCSFWTAIEYSETENNCENSAIEYSETENNCENSAINTILSAWENEQIIVGGKSMRGLGVLKPMEIKKKTFNLTDEKNRTDWLSFDIYNQDSIGNMEEWKEKEKTKKQGETVDIVLTLKQDGPLSVRVYSTEVAEGNESAPDFAQLCFRKIKEGKEIKAAVIPGTSWAGTFRHNMIGILGSDWNKAEKELEELFGRAERKESVRSKIRFSETVFDNGQYKKVSRNAIDRFSGGTANGALFTEVMYFGGTEGKLKISIPKNINKEHKRALVASIADLHEGFLTVGGEASIGHGTLSITKVQLGNQTFLSESGNSISGHSIYSFLMEGLINE